MYDSLTGSSKLIAVGKRWRTLGRRGREDMITDWNRHFPLRLRAKTTCKRAWVDGCVQNDAFSIKTTISADSMAVWAERESSVIMSTIKVAASFLLSEEDLTLVSFISTWRNISTRSSSSGWQQTTICWSLPWVRSAEGPRNFNLRLCSSNSQKREWKMRRAFWRVWSSCKPT